MKSEMSYIHLKGHVYMNKSKGDEYYQHFRQIIVELYNSTGSTYASLEGEYGIPVGTMAMLTKK